MVANAKMSNSMLINALLINTFFFAALWFPQSWLRRTRKSLYACLLFVLTLLLVFLSLLVIQADPGGFGGLLGVWAIIAMLDTGLYWLLKLMPTISI